VKRYSGAHDIPHHTCQTLGEIANGSGVKISPERFDERLAVEQEHDPEAIRASYGMEGTERFQQLCAEHAGRCCCCGEKISEVDCCPFCHSQQRFAGQRNSKQRRTENEIREAVERAGR
jgi:hypothetical protein